MGTVFDNNPNNLITRLAASYTAGQGQITVLSGDASRFGSPSPTSPVRVALVKASTIDQQGYFTDPTAISIFRVTNRSGSVLTIGEALEGTTDQNFVLGDIVLAGVTQGSFSLIHTAINSLESQVSTLEGEMDQVQQDVSDLDADLTTLESDLSLKAPLASPALTGVPTAPTPASGTSTTQIATTAFVDPVSLKIGNEVSGGTPGRVLFEDASGNLADSTNMTWDASTNRFTVASGGITTASLNTQTVDFGTQGGTTGSPSARTLWTIQPLNGGAPWQATIGTAFFNGFPDEVLYIGTNGDGALATAPRISLGIEASYYEIASGRMTSEFYFEHRSPASGGPSPQFQRRPFGCTIDQLTGSTKMSWELGPPLTGFGFGAVRGGPSNGGDFDIQRWTTGVDAASSAVLITAPLTARRAVTLQSTVAVTGGMTLSGLTNITNSGTDGVGVEGVRFQIAGNLGTDNWRHSLVSSLSSNPTNSWLRFDVASSQTTQVQALTLRGDGSAAFAGRVGVNAPSPDAQLQVTAGSAATKGLIVKAATSQTSNLFEAQDSTSTTLVYISAGGFINTTSGIGTNTITFDNGVNSWNLYRPGPDPLLYLRDNTNARMQMTFVPGATANTASTLISSLVGVNENSPGAQLQITTAASSRKGLIVKGTTSQTANLFECQSSTGTVLASVSSTGAFTVPTLNTISTLYLDGNPGLSFNSTDRYLWSGTNSLNVVKDDGTSTHLTVLNTGKVGVGTVSPAGQLEVNSKATSTVGLIVKAISSQTANLIEAQDSSGTATTVVRPDGSIGLPTLADSAAANNSLYYSSTQSKLVYKDQAGTANPLY